MPGPVCASVSVCRCNNEEVTLTACMSCPQTASWPMPPAVAMVPTVETSHRRHRPALRSSITSRTCTLDTVASVHAQQLSIVSSASLTSSAPPACHHTAKNGRLVTLLHYWHIMLLLGPTLLTARTHSPPHPPSCLALKNLDASNNPGLTYLPEELCGLKHIDCIRATSCSIDTIRDLEGCVG